MAETVQLVKVQAFAPPPALVAELLESEQPLSVEPLAAPPLSAAQLPARVQR